MLVSNKLVGNSVKLDYLCIATCNNQVKAVLINDREFHNLYGDSRGYFIKKGGKQCYFEDKKDIEKIDNYLKS